MPDARSPLELQLNGYRLTTAEITYHLPDHPNILQTFVWQQLDMAPTFPKLREFLDFWTRNIEGTLHSVYVAHNSEITTGKYSNVDIMMLH